MTHSLTATQAKTVAYTDLIVHDEVDEITRQIIAAGLNGAYTVTISDGTTMTESTPTITITGTVANPTVTDTYTVILAGQTVVLGTTGLNLNSVIADINDAAITGVVASKNASNNLVITYTTTASSWSIIIGAGTANTELGLTATTLTATDPDSVAYYTTWAGTDDDRKRAYNMAEVKSHFQDLGYNIVQKINANTTNTLEWQVYW